MGASATQRCFKRAREKLFRAAGEFAGTAVEEGGVTHPTKESMRRVDAAERELERAALKFAAECADLARERMLKNGR